VRGSANVAERLIVEITEPAAIDDFEQVRGFVSRVKDLACRVAMDDFGAGLDLDQDRRRLCAKRGELERGPPKCTC
jgi:EAL domain-containing protein (putative c-di-GMP-specific phosphodiesterase class I)